MQVGAVCTKSVVTIRGDEVIETAAERLRRFHVGDLVVIHADEARPRPIGVLTDRDIAVSLVAEVPDQLKTLRCDEVVRRPVARVSEDDDVLDAMELMIAERVRRLPVVDDRGDLVGIFSLDDALGLLSRMLVRLTALPEAQRDEERERRP